MKRKKGFKFATFIALISSLVLVLAACGSNEKSSGDGEVANYTFKATHVVQESHVWHQTALKFGEELEKLSDGRMKLEIYPASQLGQEKDMVQQLETGSVDFGFLTNAYMSTRQESLNGWFMPFAFNSLEEAVALRESAPAKEMLTELSSQGLVGLDFAFAGNRHVLLKDGFVSMDMAQNILVVRTVSGMAMAVAAAIDALHFKEVVGCIAGDDTIMIAVRTIEDTKALMDKIHKMTEK